MNKDRLLNKHTILGILILAGSLLTVTMIYIFWINPLILKPRPPLPAAVMTIIPAATSTPHYATPVLFVNTIQPSTSTPLPGAIALNTYVQITGTGGEGLRLRASPGLTSELVFLGYDAEVFLVTGGPTVVDGYTWWFLTAPYDQTRSGWAAANYLSFIPSP